MDEFKELGLSAQTIRALEKKGFRTPTPIQKLTIPILLKGDKDVVGKAQTGTGKTACFALPIIERISPRSSDVKAIILTPTRELALQVNTEILSLQGEKNFSILAVYGGAPIQDQLKALRNGVQIVVGTTGRVMDLLKRRRLNLSHIDYAVLDEADEMLNMGFVDDITEILSHTNNDKNMLLFSATMPKEILNIAKTFMREYEFIEVENTQTTALTKQVYYEITVKNRVEALHRIIDTTKDFHGIVFCKTKSMVDTVTAKLTSANYEAAALHGDMSQSQREKILGLFRKRIVTVLVATDVAARGIDVNNLTHVINFSIPRSSESYTHRVGRTGRAGKQGIAITFIRASEIRKLKNIERQTKQRIEKDILPSIKEVQEKRKKDLKEQLNSMLNDENTKKYDEISQTLLKEYPVEKIIPALLKFIFNKELELKKFNEVQISTVEKRPDSNKWNQSRTGRSRPKDKNSRHERSQERSKYSDRGKADRQKKFSGRKTAGKRNFRTTRRKRY